MSQKDIELGGRFFEHIYVVHELIVAGSADLPAGGKELEDLLTRASASSPVLVSFAKDDEIKNVPSDGATGGQGKML